MAKQTVLLMEAHPGLRENIKELLELEEYAVKVISLDSEKDDIPKIESPAVFVIDGIQFRKGLVKPAFTYQHRPIIVFSSDPDDLFLAPFSKWIPLPFQTEELLNAVKEAFNSTWSTQNNKGFS